MKNIRERILAGFAITAVVLLSLTVFRPAAMVLPAVQGTEDQAGRNLLVAVGEGEIKVKPDIAEVQVGVEHQAETAGDAQVRASSAADAIVQQLLQLGIVDGDIQTSGLSLHAVYDHERRVPGTDNAPQLVGYRASLNLTVTVREIEKTGQVVDASVNAGANRISGIRYEIADPGPHVREALADAVRDAHRKAEAMAAGAGVTIKAVVEIVEGSGAVQPYMVEDMRMAAMAGSEGSTTIMPGENSVRAEVYVKFSF